MTAADMWIETDEIDRQRYDSEVDEVFTRVFHELRVSRGRIVGKSRDARVVAARRKAARMLLARGVSPESVGRALGRDRSTVYNYVKRDGWEPTGKGD